MESITNQELLNLWNMVFNLSVHMLHNKFDAEEATQSIFEKIIEQKSTFRNESKLSTWVYRISYNYLIDLLRKRKESGLTFDILERDVNNFKPYENELKLSETEEKIYVEEIKIGCTLAMLQCLDPESRFIYILGNIFNVSQKDAADICRIEYANYRKQLSRIKEKIKNFMKNNCGLINPDAECKCRKRILIATNRGRVNPEKLLYQTQNRRIKELITEMNEIDEISKIYKNNPFWDNTENISCLKDKYKILQEIML